ncbi:MAG: AAA family ATPase [Candidatus Hodarchaeales archaeon]|jgi:chromosome segregation protein
MTYIKEVRMQGFKSFGPKLISIKLNTGFSCLIGPNGSGKSNIVDALTFCLGTRSSKSMRAERLADLLYSGIGGHPPSLECKVEVIFDNIDFAIPYPEPEISISRELKKSGLHSVYRLNGRRTSRTEILDKLKLAGIDLIHGYNVIAQGKVAEIVSMSGEERRRIIEDIAGTSSFDEKKEESLKGLEEAKRRLEELAVLVAEVSQQHADLKAEKIQMEKYLALNSEIEKQRVIILSTRAFDANDKIIALTDNINKHKKELEEIEGRKIEEKVVKLNELLENQEKDVESQTNDLEFLKTEQKSNDLYIVRIEEELKHTQNEISSKQKFSEQREKNLSNIHKKIDSAQNREKQLSNELESVTTDFLRYENEIENLLNIIAEKKEQYEELELKYQDEEREIRKIDNKITQIQVKIDYGNSVIESYKKNLQQKEKQIDEINEQLNKHNHNLTRFQTSISNVLQKRIDTDQEIQNLVEQKESFDNELNSRDQLLRQIEDNLLVLKTKLGTIQVFMERAKQDPVYEFLQEQKIDGFLGKLSDLYDKQSLPNNILHLSDAIVVEDIESAVNIIRQLKDYAVGSATFIPKTAFGSLESVNSMEFINRIMDRSEVTQSVEQAADLWIQRPNKIIVSSEGDIFNPNGTIIGGYLSGSAKEELEAVQIEINQLKENQNKYTIERNELNEKLHETLTKQKELHEKFEQIEKGLTEAYRQEGILEETIKQNKQVLNQHDQERFPLLAHIEDKQGEIQDLNNQLNHLNEQRSKLQEVLDEIKEAMKAADVSSLQNNLNELNRTKNKVENQQIRIESELEAIHRSLDDHQIQLQSLEKELQSNQEHLNSLQQLIVEKGKEFKKFQEIQGLQEKQIEDTKINVSKARKELKKTKKEWERLHTTIDQIQTKKIEIKEKIHEIELEKVIAVNLLTTVQNEAQDDGLSLQTFTKQEAEQYSEHEIIKKINRLTTQRISLEPVNMKAGQEFERMDTRYNELKEQQYVLVEEQQAIEDFISQIEAEKRNTFLKTFDAISKHFGRLFGELSEGNAKMILENPETIFDGGVDIEANPRGKKVRSLESMSGGEKTLCALSFIFAVQHVDAQPFYVLDEVDASLDPGNVDRLGRLLARLSRDAVVQNVPRKGAQFIVISHREILMAKSDLIWGVSSKKGLSNLVRMNLEEYQQQAQEREAQQRQQEISAASGN